MGSADKAKRTSAELRHEIQTTAGTIRSVAARLGVNPKTVARWRGRTGTEDAPSGPKIPVVSMSPEEEAIAVFFRMHTLLPLDDCLWVTKATVPNLTRSSMHRCFVRCGISRLSDVRFDLDAELLADSDRIGYLRIDVSEVRSSAGPLVIYVAIDQLSKMTITRFYDAATPDAASRFLESLVHGLPFRIHTVMTNDRMPFCHGEPAMPMEGIARICRADGIVHRITEPHYPWTPAHVARMAAGRLAGAAQRGTAPPPLHQAERSGRFVAQYNFKRKLKALRGLTPYDYICRAWERAPGRFRSDPRDWTYPLSGYGDRQIWGRPP